MTTALRVKSKPNRGQDTLILALTTVSPVLSQQAHGECGTNLTVTVDEGLSPDQWLQSCLSSLMSKSLKIIFK